MGDAPLEKTSNGSYSINKTVLNALTEHGGDMQLKNGKDIDGDTLLNLAHDRAASLSGQHMKHVQAAHRRNIASGKTPSAGGR